MKNSIPAPPKGNSAQRGRRLTAPSPSEQTIGVLKRQAHCALRHSSAATRGAARPARRGRDSTPADSSADRRFSAASPLRRCAAGLSPRL